jgi:hypothetical protein
MAEPVDPSPKTDFFFYLLKIVGIDTNYINPQKIPKNKLK